MTSTDNEIETTSQSQHDTLYTDAPVICDSVKQVTSQVVCHEDSTSDESRATPSGSRPVAPDGGWGWIVLFASFLSSVIVDGVCFSFGIFYLEFLDEFGENKSKTAWIGSVLNGMYMIMGKCLRLITTCCLCDWRSLKPSTLIFASLEHYRVHEPWLTAREVCILNPN